MDIESLKLDHRIIYDTVESGSKVLDLGCGDGELMVILARGKNAKVQGIELDDPGQIASAWRTALGANTPVVIDARCDPDVPPLPPHITFEQAKGFMSSLFKGDPNLGGIVKQSAKQMMSTLLSRSDAKENKP